MIYVCVQFCFSFFLVKEEWEKNQEELKKNFSTKSGFGLHKIFPTY